MSNFLTDLELAFWDAIENDAAFVAWIPTMKPAQEAGSWDLTKVRRYKCKLGASPAEGESQAIPNVLSTSDRIWLYIMVTDAEEDVPVHLRSVGAVVPLTVIGGLNQVAKNRNDLYEFATLVKDAVLRKAIKPPGLSGVTGVKVVSANSLLFEPPVEVDGGLFVFECRFTVALDKTY